MFRSVGRLVSVRRVIDVAGGLVMSWLVVAFGHAGDCCFLVAPSTGFMVLGKIVSVSESVECSLPGSASADLV